MAEIFINTDLKHYAARVRNLGIYLLGYLLLELPRKAEEAWIRFQLWYVEATDPLPKANKGEPIEHYYDRIHVDQAVRHLRLKVRLHQLDDLQRVRKGIEFVPKRDQQTYYKLIDLMERTYQVERRLLEQALAKKAAS